MSRHLIILNHDADRLRALRWVEAAPLGYRIEFKATKRTLPQNDRFWAMLTDVQVHMRKQGRDYSTDQWKVIFLHAIGRETQFLPALDGRGFIPYGQSSSDLLKGEMSDLMEFIFAWGAENGVMFNDPAVSPSRPATGAAALPSRSGPQTNKGQAA